MVVVVEEEYGRNNVDVVESLSSSSFLLDISIVDGDDMFPPRPDH